jgi:hypothetical protein
MTSIVIPLGTGSRWGDKELRYTLRSVEKHLSGYGDIFIIGECPNWLQNVVHIPATEGDKTYEKERNIWNKIMLAYQDERVSNDFLFMNDDHFLLQDYQAGKFPFYAYGFLSDYLTREDQYKNTLQNTFDQFGDNLYFDIHCPIVYNKAALTVMNELWSWPEKWGYCIKTLYCIFKAGVDGLQAEHIPDLKISEALPASRIRELISGRPWFSMNNRAREGSIETVLQELYPIPSKYEKR